MNPLFLVGLLALVGACVIGCLLWVGAMLVFFRVFPRNAPERLRVAAAACCIVLSPVASLVLTYPLFGEGGFFLGPIFAIIVVATRRNRRPAALKSLDEVRLAD